MLCSSSSSWCLCLCLCLFSISKRCLYHVFSPSGCAALGRNRCISWDGPIAGTRFLRGPPWTFRNCTRTRRTGERWVGLGWCRYWCWWRLRRCVNRLLSYQERWKLCQRTRKRHEEDLALTPGDIVPFHDTIELLLSSPELSSSNCGKRVIPLPSPPRRCRRMVKQFVLFLDFTMFSFFFFFFTCL